MVSPQKKEICAYSTAPTPRPPPRLAPSPAFYILTTKPLSPFSSFLIFITHLHSRSTCKASREIRNRERAHPSLYCSALLFSALCCEKMVRAPCCEKMGLKKGPWSGEEDQILVNYIHLHGHGNWRALPKLAGLLRCGKSCRLRWTNYLRPDIKRGNFSLQEEHTILELHNLLGNRWSTIAAKLPGRTDNEIKNVWHTHLKKKAAANHDDSNNINNHQQQQQPTTKKRRSASKKSKTASVKPDQQTKPPAAAEEAEAKEEYSSDDVSSLTTGDNGGAQSNDAKPDDFSSTEEMDESFWSEVLSADSSTSTDHDFPAAELGSGLYDDPLGSFVSSEGDGPKGGEAAAAGLAHSIVDYTSMDFWYNLLTGDNNKD
ncbi:unnamed protein product [Linum tenue]|uniref:Uncharacterized protein n=1 Tax=Linum tenue TaxID=586396 RepID=A0AAV0HKL1_9ROSI|nr:unnamed protein product [Linum tenue]